MSNSNKALYLERMFGIINMVISMREILHCDLNSFFASVECLKRPELKKVPMAVAGDPKLRHGIILAKNELAKKYGIYTPETVYSALKKCPKLVLVKGNYSDYKKYSRLVNNIYLKYTDRVEPFGIDESFLDVTSSLKLFNMTSFELANRIREEIKNKLGLTISVGVSFNKSLAKLGSDLKKPDAVSEIPYNKFREVIYPLPVNMLLYVGKSANTRLQKIGIRTIGDLATYNKSKLVKKMGKLGEMIYNYANVIDYEEVKKFDEEILPKSVSKGVTFAKDIENREEVIKCIKKLSDIVAFSLRKDNLKCTTVSISIKYSNFSVINRQKKIISTDLFQDISKAVIKLFNENYTIGKVRAITVGVTDLKSKFDEVQLSLFDKDDEQSNIKLEKVSRKIDDLRLIYGEDKINFGSVIK